ncbi:MAG: hypothetical protein NTV49_00590 [Kiritimatiellaeota bacterium]|nr:hypothetical protein [Kiritimatiellota bacterium]
MTDQSTPTSGAARRSRAPGLAPPPRQRPYDQALQRGFDALRERRLDPERLRSLGATLTAGTLRLPVLHRRLCLDLEQRRVLVADAGPARAAWAVLAVHYLCADNLAPDPRAVSFPAGRRRCSRRPARSSAARTCPAAGLATASIFFRASRSP